MSKSAWYEWGASHWIEDLELSMATMDEQLFGSLFTGDACWRDTVVLTWDYRQAHGREPIKDLLWTVSDEIKPRNFRLSAEWPEPSEFGPSDPPLIEFFFSFDTKESAGTAIARAVQDASSKYGFRVRQLHTKIDSLNRRQHPEPHPAGNGFSPSDPKENWAQYRERMLSFTDRDPEVLIIGAGHSGMMLAAHLNHLGIESLIADKNDRIGDNWRTRYHNLALHTPIQMIQFPYMRYPEHFPEYLPKDKLADWFETYAKSMDLNCWLSSEFLGGSFDESSRTWTARLRTADGVVRELHPRHLVLATGGVGGHPKIPELPGLDSFAGDVIHSSAFTRGEDYVDKKAIVVGVGTSAHDIAQDLYDNGAAVTMVQRNPVAVVSIDSANLGYADYFNGVPDDLVDFRFAADITFPLFREALQQYQAMVAQRDADLLEQLTAVGMRLEDVHDADRSWFMKFFKNGGGYYLNIGTSDIIASGGISIVQNGDIDHYSAQGAVLKDGSNVDADVIVMATGYEDRQTQLVDFFGAEVAEKVGHVGRGFDEDGEWNNVWKPNAQPGLWFMLGGIKDSRPNADQLALLLAAEIDGLIPDGFRERARRHGRAGSLAVPA